MKDFKPMRIGVITFPFSDTTSATAGHELFSNFLKILEPLSSEMFVITGNFPENRVSSKKIHIQNINRHTKEESSLAKFLNYLWTQLIISVKLVKVSKQINTVIFYIGGAALLLPALSARLLTKKVVIFTTGLASQTATKIYNERLFGIGRFLSTRVLTLFEHINFHLANQIVVESEGAIDSQGLNKYRRKISSFACAPYINFNLFQAKNKLKDRRDLIGYIGRLSAEKGVQNFAKAIPLILKERSELEFLIGGDGPLLGELKSELQNIEPQDKVKFTGWIPHDELAKYLNELKLIVSPSFAEGGVPAVILEAMACGTIVLVTSVAGVDIIKDGENGFVLQDNSPESIAKKVIQVLEHPHPEKLTNRALNLAREKYSYEKMVSQFKNMLYGE